MAKRGYRGKGKGTLKQKVGKVGRSKYSTKLRKEYLKTKDKMKYDYIETHYFNPVSTCVLNFGDADGGKKLVVDDNTGNQRLTLISTDGTTRSYSGSASENAAAGVFTITNASGSLANCINHANGHKGKIFCNVQSGSLILIQAEPGPDGNTLVSGSIQAITASGHALGVAGAGINGRFFFDADEAYSTSLSGSYI
jgi:hypothetical protein